MNTTPGGTQPDSASDAPKIIVDADWKAQAQAEKDRLAQQEKTSAATGSASASGQSGEPSDQGPTTPFAGLVATLATQALLYLGAIPDPETGRAIVAPEHAKMHIDMLAVIEEKTRGNLTKDEEEELKAVLHELRMRFVQLVGKLDELMAEEQRKGAGDNAPSSAADGPNL